MNDKLIERYLDGTASGAERREVEAWFEAQGEALPDIYNNDEARSEAARERTLALLQERIKRNPQRLVPLRRRFYRYAVAASVLLCCGTGLYFYARQHQKQAAAILAKNDIAPGGSKAILTLSNGQQIILDGKKGRIASQAGEQMIINADGGIAYSGNANSSAVIYNTLTVPIGNRRDLVLPDGSQVSLDAGSSITYPVVFDRERKVSVTGEAYLVVKHDPAHPFYTTVKGVSIQDIGTEFNIDAYDDEPAVKTTLISGSVKVNETILKPGEQAQSKETGTVIKPADLKSVTAWKDNDFYFRNQSLKTSMRQIARWYNVSVVYDHIDERLKIFLDVSRSINLSVVLKAIENTGKVKCSLEGRTVTLSQPN